MFTEHPVKRIKILPRNISELNSEFDAPACLIRIILHRNWRGHQISPTVLSLKRRLSQKLQSQYTFSCENVQKHILINEPEKKKKKMKIKFKKKNELENRLFSFLGQSI